MEREGRVWVVNCGISPNEKMVCLIEYIFVDLFLFWVESSEFSLVELNLASTVQKYLKKGGTFEIGKSL